MAATVPITLALLTPLFYLNGKAFYEGYLSYLNLNTTMFPQDTAATMMSAVIAWLSATTGGLAGTSVFLNEYWPWALVTALSSALGFGTLNWWLKKTAKQPENKKFEGNLPPSLQAWLKDVTTIIVWLFVPTYGLFLLMLFVAIFILSTLLPFLHLGKQHAAEQLEKGFVNAPLILAIDPEGVSAEYRIVECSERFCALYRQGQMVTVPVSSINWAVSDIRKRAKE